MSIRASIVVVRYSLVELAHLFCGQYMLFRCPPILHSQSRWSYWPTGPASLYPYLRSRPFARVSNVYHRSKDRTRASLRPRTAIGCRQTSARWKLMSCVSVPREVAPRGWVQSPDGRRSRIQSRVRRCLVGRPMDRLTGVSCASWVHRPSVRLLKDQRPGLLSRESRVRSGLGASKPSASGLQLSKAPDPCFAVLPVLPRPD